LAFDFSFPPASIPKPAMNNNPTIIPYSDILNQQVLQVWEESVLATHHFLSTEDFNEIKGMVSAINFNEFTVFCSTDNNQVTGFIGVADKKIEMLFVAPVYFGKGLGKALLLFAINQLHATRVDVNEQNESAVKFYKKHGFKTNERTEKDDQGRNYPLLRMKL
jgi:putative acetyltransferase